jgi:hypothetical protein
MWKRRARELQAACFASKDVIKACIETLASFVQRPRGSLTRGRAGPPSLNRSRILEIVWPARAWRLPASGHISKRPYQIEACTPNHNDRWLRRIGGSQCFTSAVQIWRTRHSMNHTKQSKQKPSKANGFNLSPRSRRVLHSTNYLTLEMANQPVLN